MTPAAALLAFRSLVVSLSGLADTAVLLSYGDLARPTTAHATVTVVSDVAIGRADPQVAGATRQRRQMVVQVDGYYPTAVDAVRRLATMLQSDDARLLAATVAIQGVGGVVTRTEWWHTAYEPRAMVEVRVGYEALVSSVQAPVEIDTITLDVNDIIIPILEPIP